LAQAGVDNDAVDGPELCLKGAEHLEHLRVIIHIQGTHAHADARVARQQFCTQSLQTLGAARAQGEVPPLCRKGPRHAFTQSGTGACDQDGLAQGHAKVSGSIQSKGRTQQGQGCAARNSCSAATVRAGSSSCGTCPRSSNITRRLPGTSCANSLAFSGGIRRSWPPQMISVGCVMRLMDADSAPTGTV